MFPQDVVVLGPQRHRPTVANTIASRAASLGLDLPRARYAVVTAGWEEREGEDAELRAHLCAAGGEMTNLALFRRAEDAFRRDPELLGGLLRHHGRMKRLQELYRLRLGHALDAARALLVRGQGGADGDLLASEQAEAIADVRRIDATHLGRLREQRDASLAELRPHEREAVAPHRAEIERVIETSDVVCVAGGHVQILLNRLRLFGLVDLIGERPVFAWSAGAMALSDRLVVFHDSPPQGPGNAEVLEAGVGLFHGLVPLPHARHRLRLEDPVRVALFARRFGPAVCAVLDEGTRVDWDGNAWSAGPGTRRLTAAGTLEEISA